MRTRIFSALIFALLTSASVAVNATAAPSSSAVSPATMENAAPAAVHEQRNDKVNLNTADAQMLQKELAGIGKTRPMPSLLTGTPMASLPPSMN